MHTAPFPAEPARQTHQGVGARIVRRFGRAVRGAISGILRPGSRQRPAASPSATPAPAAAGLEPPAPPSRLRIPHQPRVPRRPRAERRPRIARWSAPTQPIQPTRSGWMARWFGRKPRQPASGPSLSATSDFQFTTEAYPELTPEACAILNTPVGDCDPELLRLMVSVFAAQLAAMPELGLSDAKALFATLWQRLGAPLGDTAPDAAPDAAPATTTDAPTRSTAGIAGRSTGRGQQCRTRSAAGRSSGRRNERRARSAAGAAERAARSNSGKFTGQRGTRCPRHFENQAGHHSPVEARFPPQPIARAPPAVPLSPSPTGRVPRAAPKTPPPRRLCYAACAGPP